MNMKRFLAFALTLCMLISLVPMAPARAAEDETLDFEELDGSGLDLDILNPNMDDSMVVEESYDENEMVKVIVVMDEESILEGNSQAVLTEGVQNEMDAMEYQQNVIVAQIEEDVLDGDQIQVDYNYTWLINGFATAVPYGAIKTIEALTGVERVVIQEVYSVCETTNEVAAPNTITDGVMIGRESTWANGYTGEGMKIAIIDTGLDTDHPNFAPLDEDKLTDTSASADTVAAVLENLNASKRYEGLSVSDVYYSSKVVFGFNYCDSDLDVTHDYDGVSDHGTHVAGIAAANKVDGSEVVGVAPDAQLYVMKVFGKNGGAYPADILAALEDALMLGADVINMSLGSPAGFTTSGDEYMDSVYASVAKTGTVLSVSAGNNYTSGYDNMWGTDLNQTMYPDNGVGGQPGTYANTLTVASVENWKIQRNYIDAEGYHFTYIESGGYGFPSVLTLTGEYEFVVIPGNGEPSDYEGLDVTGKIALVQRGVTSFLEKHQAAEKAGAIACLVYNNVSGEFGMDMTGTTCKTPAAAITMADGAYLAANPGLKLSFPEAPEAFPSATAYQMSDFSSQGPAPDLTLNPDITAPGGNIYSTIKDGQYGLMSGTSMAAPNIAGMTALVMQYVKETFPEGTDYRAVTQALLMSTSVPLEYAEGVAYSPRVQGSGLANVFNAVTTNAYLSVDGADNAKADVGDDAGRTGVYTFSFNVHNFGANAAFYELGTTVQTEDVAAVEGYYFMSGTPLDLGSETEETSDSVVFTHDVDNDGDTDSHDAYYIYQAAQKTPVESGWEAESFRYDVNADEAVAEADVQAYLDALVGKTSDADLEDTVLMVASGETAAVNVTVTLGDEEKAYFDTYYPNGGYVEGFTTLTALHTEGVDLSLPYLAFYGDWAESPVLDDGDYISYVNDGYAGNQYFHALFSQLGGDEFGMCPGMNPYVEEAIDPAHISLSPNGDGNADSITDIYLSLMRNAEYMEMRFTNVETGEVLFQTGGNHATKTVYSAANGQIIPFYYTGDGDLPELPDFEGLENNTKLLFEAEAVGVDPDSEPETWSVPITIDLEAPQLLSVKRSEDLNTGEVTLDLTFQDNLAGAACVIADGLGQYALAMEGVEDVEPDENGYQNYTVSFDITDLSGKVMIILCDYAVNQSYYGVNLGGEGTPYGDLVAYQYNYYTGTNGWVSFNSDVDMDETGIFSSFDMDFVAAEYVNGFVYAQTDTGALYGFEYADMLENTVDLEDVYITQLNYVYQDFAYSYVEGKLYGLCTYVDDYGYPTSEINSINLRGAYFDEDMYMDVEPFQEDWFVQRGGVYGLTLAIDGAGTMYVLGNTYDYDTEELSETAHLWTAVREEYSDRWGSYVDYYFQETGDTGMTMDFLQSMTWDHNAEKLYWARFDGGASYIECELIEIDPTAVTEDENGNAMVSATKVGTLSGETCALFAPLTEETAAKEPYTNVPEMDKSVVGTPILRDATVTMSLGGTRQLGYDFDPWYTDYKELVWSTSDESIVTVDESGTITAVAAGSATITAANKADETKFDTVTVEVTALDLVFEGVVSAQTAGTGATTGTSTYKFEMVEGLSTFGTVNPITASEDMNYGLSLATSEMGRGSIWACEYGNTGMIYEIDPETGAVKDALMPIDGDMMFGLHYSETLDSFTGIMNFFLYVDIPMNQEMYDEMQNSYDEEQMAFMWHRINMLPYLEEANGGFITGETGQGASSEIVFCGITGIEGGMKDAYGQTYFYDTYKDYMGNWVYGGSVNYQPTQTLVLLDNVGRLWFIDEIASMTKTTDEYGNAFYTSADGMSSIEHYGQHRNGMFEMEYGVNEDGTVNCSVFNIRQVLDTALTDMFRDGSMPRITYHFSDIELAGYTAEGDPMFAISLYDYWNNGITNELYLLIPGRETEEWDYETNSAIRTPDRLFALGNTGENNIIASIHFAEVTGGLDNDEEAAEEFSVNKLAAGLFKQQ